MMSMDEMSSTSRRADYHTSGMESYVEYCVLLHTSYA